jgi:hypothetical protein
MKKRSIDGNWYLDYLWELGELPVYTIGGFGVSVSLKYDCPYVVRIRGSSKGQLKLDPKLSTIANEGNKKGNKRDKKKNKKNTY